MKIIHLADLHLGYRAYNKITSKGLNIREKDIIRAFKECLDKITEIRPELIIMAGDIFHRPRPGNTSIYLCIKFLIDFRNRCSSPIVIISGNHEASKSLENENILRVIEATVPGVKVIDRQIEQFALEDKNISILGIPYNALCDFEKTSIKPDENYKYNILTIHGSYDSIKCPELDTYGQASLINSENINQNKWNYVALGHYHKYTKLAENTFYSGAIERTSSNIWQEAKDPKGFIEYNLETGKHIFHELKTPRNVFDIEEIDVSNLQPAEIDTLMENEMAKIPHPEDSIIRITLKNIDNYSLRNLDYKKIRLYRKNLLHFRLNFIKKDRNQKDNQHNLKEGKDLFKFLEEDLQDFDLATGLNKEKFDSLARDYLYNTASIE